jgi:hypothetical protein
MYNGQAQQDKFALKLLHEKRNGFFVECGSHNAIIINNTYLLEKQYDWKGIMIEYDITHLNSYKTHRPNSIHVIQDATTIDYKQLFETNHAPFSIDYLQIDLEPSNNSTLQTLQKIDRDVMDTYQFATVTFEHDLYGGSDIYLQTRNKSRDIFKRRGYINLFEDINNGGVNPYEDWYVHPDLVDMEYVTKLIQMNEKHYIRCGISERSINWQDIEY